MINHHGLDVRWGNLKNNNLYKTYTKRANFWNLGIYLPVKSIKYVSIMYIPVRPGRRNAEYDELDDTE